MENEKEKYLRLRRNAFVENQKQQMNLQLNGNKDSKILAHCQNKIYT